MNSISILKALINRIISMKIILIFWSFFIIGICVTIIKCHRVIVLIHISYGFDRLNRGDGNVLGLHLFIRLLWVVSLLLLFEAWWLVITWLSWRFSKRLFSLLNGEKFIRVITTFYSRISHILIGQIRYGWVSPFIIRGSIWVSCQRVHLIVRLPFLFEGATAYSCHSWSLSKGWSWSITLKIRVSI